MRCCVRCVYAIRTHMCVVGKVSYRLFFRHFNIHCLVTNFYGMLVSALQSITLFNIIVFIYIIQIIHLVICVVYSRTFLFKLALFDKYFRFECKIDRGPKAQQRERGRPGERQNWFNGSISHKINKMSNTYLFIFIFPSGGYAYTYMCSSSSTCVCVCVRAFEFVLS